MRRVVVVGAGFGGLSAACYLARAGYSVTVLEKNDQVGGRAMVTHQDGFQFDMGPSWYMMPDVFERFFADFDKKPSDYYQLTQLDPSYKIFTSESSYDVHTAPKVYELFERLEPGSSVQLKKLLTKTGKEYRTVVDSILEQPMMHWRETLDPEVLKMLLHPERLGSYHSRIAKYIKHPDLQKILEFMVVFMGGSPHNIPALYSLLAYVDMGLGIWYPHGGMGKVAEAMYALAQELGVTFKLAEPALKITNNAVTTTKDHYDCDAVVVNADYHHAETQLLSPAKPTRNWQKATTSPSALLIYLGVRKKLKNLAHHNMFFDVDWDVHFDDVFISKQWSDKPMLYVGAPSVTDATVAPAGCENMFVLAPMAAGDQPSRETIERTADDIITRLEAALGEPFAQNIIVRNVHAHDYFKDTFNAYRGNAFGLAHTLRQSAIFRPPIKHKKLKNVYFVGQYTNPGTGVPMVTIGGKVTANSVIADMGNTA